MAFELTWLGHASLGLKPHGYNILVDSFLKNNPTVLGWEGPLSIETTPTP